MVDEKILVRNKPEYWEFIRTLRNEMRAYFTTTHEIQVLEHRDFMNNYGDQYYICLVDGKPVGFVGSVNGDIRIAVTKEYQHQGIGVFMINKLSELAPESQAVVKVDNSPSQQMFNAAGYEITHVIMRKVDV